MDKSEPETYRRSKSSAIRIKDADGKVVDPKKVRIREQEDEYYYERRIREADSISTTGPNLPDEVAPSPSDITYKPPRRTSDPEHHDLAKIVRPSGDRSSIAELDMGKLNYRRLGGNIKLDASGGHTYQPPSDEDIASLLSKLSS
jgi:hypothetical protein